MTVLLQPLDRLAFRLDLPTRFGDMSVDFGRESLATRAEREQG